MVCCDKNKYQFIYIFLIVLTSWILIDLWGHVINNLCYETLGMNKNSTIHALIIATTITIIFVVVIIYLDDEGEQIKKDINFVSKI